MSELNFKGAVVVLHKVRIYLGAKNDLQECDCGKKQQHFSNVKFLKCFIIITVFKMIFRVFSPKSCSVVYRQFFSLLKVTQDESTHTFKFLRNCLAIFSRGHTENFSLKKNILTFDHWLAFTVRKKLPQGRLTQCHSA